MLNFSSRLIRGLSRNNSGVIRRSFSGNENGEITKYSQVLAIRTCSIDNTSSLNGIARIFIPGHKTPPFSDGKEGSISVLPSKTRDFFLSNLYSKSDIYSSDRNEINTRNFPVSGEAIVHQLNKGNPIPETEISHNGKVIGIFEKKYDTETEKKAKKKNLRYFILVDKDEKYYLNEIIDGKEVPAVFSSSVINFDERTKNKNEILEQKSAVEKNYKKFIQKIGTNLPTYKTLREDCPMLSSIIFDVNSIALKTNLKFRETFRKKLEELEENEKSRPKTTVQISLFGENEKLNKSYNQRYSGSGYNNSAGGD